jgi:hypothetical protein
MKSIISTLVLTCLFSWQLIHAQGPREIILYDGANFAGNSVTVTVGT